MPEIDLNHVAVFLRVAELESFTAAAAALDLPKSSVSRSVAHLEQQLGVRLLQRTTRRLGLTEAGRHYFDRARAAIADLDDATAAVADMGREPRGTVRVTAPADLAVALLPDVLARFARRHPGIHVELHLGSRVVDLVEEGFDLAVRAGRLEDSSLVARRVGTTGLALFASARYLRRRGRPKAAADLARHDCVLFRSREGRRPWRLQGPRGEESVVVGGPVEVDDLAFVHRAVLADLGIGLLPIYLCVDAVKRGEIERVLPSFVHLGAPIQVVSPPKLYEPARVTLLREFLVENLGKVNWEGPA